jgi:hypothetical protein
MDSVCFINPDLAMLDLLRGAGRNTRAVPEFVCRFEGGGGWHFLEENATQRQWFRGTAILEPLECQWAQDGANA